IRPKRLSGRINTYPRSLSLSAFSAPLKFATTRVGYTPRGRTDAVAFMKALLIANRVAFSG
ncbi:hypothetical protein PHYSODRAFT_379671, partial [Phytophthora sojae]